MENVLTDLLRTKTSIGLDHEIEILFNNEQIEQFSEMVTQLASTSIIVASILGGSIVLSTLIFTFGRKK